MGSVDTGSAEEMLRIATQLPIAKLQPEITNPDKTAIKAVVTVIWPYSSSNNTFTIGLAEPDFRLRWRRGQVRVHFSGSSARQVAQTKLGSGDSVWLSLEGVEWVKAGDNGQTPGRSIDWELKYTEKLLLQVEENETQHLTTVAVDHPPPPQTVDEPVVRYPSPEPITTPPHTAPSSTRPSLLRNEVGEFSSPAFIKRARVSYGSLIDSEFNSLIDDDGAVKGKGRKRARFSLGSRQWRFASRSPSPDDQYDEDSSEYGTTKANKPVMTDEGCQTMEFDFPAALTTNSASQATAVIGEARQREVQASAPGKLDTELHPQIVVNDGDMGNPQYAHMFETTTSGTPSSPKLFPISSESLPLISPLMSTGFGSFGGDQHQEPEGIANSVENVYENFHDQQTSTRDDIYGVSPVTSHGYQTSQYPNGAGFEGLQAMAEAAHFGNQYGRWQSEHMRSDANSPFVDDADADGEPEDDEAGEQMYYTRPPQTEYPEISNAGYSYPVTDSATDSSLNPPSGWDTNVLGALFPNQHTTHVQSSPTPVRPRQAVAPVTVMARSQSAHSEVVDLTEESGDDEDEGDADDASPRPTHPTFKSHGNMEDEEAGSNSGEVVAEEKPIYHYNDTPDDEDEEFEDEEQDFDQPGNRYPPGFRPGYERRGSFQSEEQSEGKFEDEDSQEEELYDDDDESVNDDGNSSRQPVPIIRMEREVIDLLSDSDDEAPVSSEKQQIPPQRIAVEQNQISNEESESGENEITTSEAALDGTTDDELEFDPVHHLDPQAQGDEEEEGEEDEEVEDDDVDEDEDEEDEGLGGQHEILPVAENNFETQNEVVARPEASRHLSELATEDGDSISEESIAEAPTDDVVETATDTDLEIVEADEPETSVVMTDDADDADELAQRASHIDDSGDDTEPLELQPSEIRASPELLIVSEASDVRLDENASREADDDVLMTDVVDTSFLLAQTGNKTRTDLQAVQLTVPETAQTRPSSDVYTEDALKVDGNPHKLQAIRYQHEDELQVHDGLANHDASVEEVLPSTSISAPDTTQRYNISDTTPSSPVSQSSTIRAAEKDRWKEAGPNQFDRSTSSTQEIRAENIKQARPASENGAEDEKMQSSGVQLPTPADTQVTAEPPIELPNLSTAAEEGSELFSGAASSIKSSQPTISSAEKLIADDSQDSLPQVATVDSVDGVADSPILSHRMSADVVSYDGSHDEPDDSQPLQTQLPIVDIEPISVNANERKTRSVEAASPKPSDIQPQQDDTDPDVVTESEAAMDTTSAPSTLTRIKVANGAMQHAHDEPLLSTETNVVDTPADPAEESSVDKIHATGKRTRKTQGNTRARSKTPAQEVAMHDSTSAESSPLSRKIPAPDFGRITRSSLKQHQAAGPQLSHATASPGQSLHKDPATTTLPTIHEARSSDASTEVTSGQGSAKPQALPQEVLRTTRSAAKRGDSTSRTVEDNADVGITNPTTKLGRATRSSVKTDILEKVNLPPPQTPVKLRLTKEAADSRFNRSPAIIPDKFMSTSDHDASAELAKTAMASPNKSAGADAGTTHSELSLKLTKDLRTNFSDYTALKSIRFHTEKKADVLVVAISPSLPPQQATKGPRHWHTRFAITDTSTAPAGIFEVQIFRPLKAALPVVETGDGLLLRRMEIKHDRRALNFRSGDDSSWAVFKKDGSEQVNGPPIEFDDREREHVRELRTWYESLGPSALAKLEKVMKAKGGNSA